MENTYLETALTALVPAVIVLLTWAVKFLTSFLQAKSEEAKTKVKLEKTKAYIDMVSNNAITVVNALNQTVVEDLKKKSADGKLTTEDMNSISSTAFNTLVSSMSDDCKEIITQTFGDLNVYVTNLIENAVVKAHNTKISTGNLIDNVASSSNDEIVG